MPVLDAGALPLGPGALSLHAHAGLGDGAHAIHLAILGAGVVGLVALLTPRFLAEPQAPRDEHEARVLALRTALAPPTTGLDPAARSATATTATTATTAERLLLPLAVVSSTAAAGVHAAVLPAHARDSLLLGAFFAGSSLLQLLWAGIAAHHPSRRLLAAGAVGNLAMVGLWAITRTLGLPFGLLPGPEALGPWDLACAGWELVVVGCGLALLRSPALPRRLPGWRHWHPALPAYVAASALLLAALSTSGASS